MSLLRDVIMDVPAQMSNFNLSTRERTDIVPGLLYPLYVQEVLPGDSFYIKPTMRMTTAPPLAPLMSSHEMEVDFFFVPTRLYVQSLDINRIQFTPSATEYPTCQPLNCEAYPIRHYPLPDIGKVNRSQSNPGATLGPSFAMLTQLGVPYTGTIATWDSASWTGQVTPMRQMYHWPYLVGESADANGVYDPDLASQAASQFEIAYNSYMGTFFSKSLVSYLKLQSPTDYFMNIGFTGSESEPGMNGGPYMAGGGYSVALHNSLEPTGLWGAGFSGEYLRNAIPLIGYYDIFRNYYANTQEEDCWINAYAPGMPSGTPIVQRDFADLIGSYQNGWAERQDTPDGDVYYAFNPFYGGIWASWCHFPLRSIDDFIDQFVKGGTSFETAWYNTIGSGGYGSTSDPLMRRPFCPTGFVPIDPVFLPTASMAPSVLGSFAHHGLMARTYSPDVNTAWLSTATYDAMKESSAINVENGQVTVQQIRTASHLLEYDERGLVAGGRYDDWVYAQFGRRNRGKLCIPEYLGRYKSTLVFDELYSTNANNDAAPESGAKTTLGQQSGKGFGLIRGTRPIELHSNEHGYIIGIFSLKPSVSYDTGYKELYDKTTFGDIYAPVLGRVGFQPRMAKYVDSGVRTVAYSSLTGTGSSAARQIQSVQIRNSIYGLDFLSTNPHQLTIDNRSLGYQPAWTEYMTDVDRASGAFRRTGELNYWVLTRKFGIELDRLHKQGAVVMEYDTSYILPWQYEYPFADQTQDFVGNFYLQADFDVMARRRISKTVMPTLA